MIRKSQIWMMALIYLLLTYASIAQALTFPRPNPLDFGPVDVGKSQDLTLTGNGGPGSVIAFQIQGTNASDFQIVDNHYSFVVPAGTPRTAIIRFTPTASGERRARIRIRHFASGSITIDTEEFVDLVGGKAKLTITAAKMKSDHELEVSLKREFGAQKAEVNVELTIGTGQYSTPKQLLGSSVNSESFVVDLSAIGVPRFKKNEDIHIHANAHMSVLNGIDFWDDKQIVVLLPVILVPGLNNGAGGFANLGELRDELKTRSDIIIQSRFGEGYKTIDDNTTYPTLYALEYATNFDSFAEASGKLQALVLYVILHTYAERVNIVGYSKGGLVARKYLVSGGSNSVHHFILCAVPNVGSVAANYQDIIGGNADNMLPAWPWLKNSSAEHLFSCPPVRELDDLNKIPMPTSPDIIYTLYYSNSGSLPIPCNNAISMIRRIQVYKASVSIPRFESGPGDGIVPAFSALGYRRNLNDKRDPNGLYDDERIPAFRGVPFLVKYVDGYHAGYMKQPGMLAELPARLLDGL